MIKIIFSIRKCQLIIFNAKQMKRKEKGKNHMPVILQAKLIFKSTPNKWQVLNGSYERFSARFPADLLMFLSQQQSRKMSPIGANKELSQGHTLISIRVKIKVSRWPALQHGTMVFSGPGLLPRTMCLWPSSSQGLS